MDERGSKGSGIWIVERGFKGREMDESGDRMHESGDRMHEDTFTGPTDVLQGGSFSCQKARQGGEASNNMHDTVGAYINNPVPISVWRQCVGWPTAGNAGNSGAICTWIASWMGLDAG